MDSIVAALKKGQDRIVFKQPKKKITFKLEDGIDECIKITSGLIKKATNSFKDIKTTGVTASLDLKKREEAKKVIKISIYIDSITTLY
jgi:inorganic pyrophosphatase